MKYLMDATSESGEVLFVDVEADIAERPTYDLEKKAWCDFNFRMPMAVLKQDRLARFLEYYLEGVYGDLYINLTIRLVDETDNRLLEQWQVNQSWPQSIEFGFVGDERAMVKFTFHVGQCIRSTDV